MPMILEFFGDECSHCQAMKPIVEKLKTEGAEIQSFEVWHNDNNANKMDNLDKGRCGGVPFYINLQTDKWICGETSYDELKSLIDAI